MSVTDLLSLIAALAAVVFVITSMLAMGMGLTMAQIIQPLKNVRFVLLALLANFVLTPLLAYAITLVIPLEESLQTGLIVLSLAAGAPFLPKLVATAKGDIALGVGLMVLLMVVTIFYLPIVLPLLLPGAAVNPWDIAKSLITLMLVPLGIGLLVRSHWPDDAARWGPLLNKISGISILILIVVALGLNISNIIGLIGSFGLLALLVFILGTLGIGALLGGRNPAVRAVMGLGTAQRNVSAVILVTTQNFSDGDTLSFVLVAAVLMLVILMPAAKRLGRGGAAATETGSAAS